jgi:hypothetical protein
VEAGEGAGREERDVRRRQHQMIAVGRVGDLHRHHHLRRLQHLQELALHPHPGDVLGGPRPGEDGVVLPGGDLVELVEEHHADRREQRVVVGRVQQPGEDGAGILAHVPGLRVGGDVDAHRRQVQDVLEQQLDQVALAAPGRTRQQHVGLGQQLLALDAVEVDALDAPHVPVGRQRHRPARLDLAAITQLLQLGEDRPRREHGQIAHELDEMFEPRLAVLLERLLQAREGYHPNPAAARAGRGPLVAHRAPFLFR